MPDETEIREYYSVSCRPFDGDGAGAVLLERARREYFERGVSGGTVRSVEDGKEVRTRYRLGPKRFHWKKTCGGVTLEEAFGVGGGLWRLVTHDFAGRLLSSHTYGSGLRWLRTAYYDAAGPADPAAVLRRGENGLFLLRRGGAGEAFLAPCPWEPGTAAQSFVNAKAGEPLVTARTDAGGFCFCAEEECALRLELRRAAGEGPSLSLGGDEPETLDFRVIPNAPLPRGAGNVSDPAGFPPREKPADEGRRAYARSVQTMARSAGGRSGEYDANLEISFENAPGPARRAAQPAKYAVAAKGLAGGVRGHGALSAGASPFLSARRCPAACTGPGGGSKDEAPRCPAGLGSGSMPPAPIPAKRIVVSSMESYLYFGKLLRGLREGRGRTAMPDGRTAYEGGYRDDLRDGFGVYYRKNGELCYAGEWKRNLRDGLGVAFGAKDGTIFVGKWKDGAATGQGSEFGMDGGLTYTGGWKDGRRHGYGTEYLGGRVRRSGFWRDDVFCPEETSRGPLSP